MTDITERLRDAARIHVELAGQSALAATINAGADEIDRLRTRAAELERDAARYRWLRGTIFLAAVDGYENSYRREKLDAFIDNAMAKDGA